MIVINGVANQFVEFLALNADGARVAVDDTTAGLVFEYRFNNSAAWTPVAKAPMALGVWASGGVAPAGDGGVQWGLPATVGAPLGGQNYAVARMSGGGVRTQEVRIDYHPLPTATLGAEGRTLNNPVTVRTTSVQAIASTVWAVLKTAVEAGGLTTIGGWLIDTLTSVLAKVGLIGVGGSVVVAPLTPNGDGEIFAGADYAAAALLPLDIRVTGKPDMTGLPLFLGLGVDGSKQGTIVDVGAGVVVSGAPGDQVVRFEPAASDTHQLYPFIGRMVEGVVRCEFPKNGSGAYVTPCASIMLLVRNLFLP